jgi:sugar phosphate permease
MDRLVRAVGRSRLLLGSTGISAVLIGLLVLPLPTPAMAALLVLAGLALGLGQPLSMSVVSMTATEGTRGTWMSIRLLGNRLGQTVIPVGVGVFATALGAGGVFLALGVTTAAATLGAIAPLRSMDD